MGSVSIFKRLWIAIGGSYQSCPLRIVDLEQPITASIVFSAIVDESAEPSVQGVFEGSNDLVNWFEASETSLIPPGASALSLAGGAAKFYRLVISNSSEESSAVGVISSTVDNATVGESWMVAADKAGKRGCGCHG
jgi:hypothetical protein